MGIALIIVGVVLLIYVGADTKKGIDAGGCLPTIALAASVVCFIAGFTLLFSGF